ncbi:exosortase [Acidobacteria bacterium AB60]|nr:exosortase [Acidobacteria bacterium AB60]
MTTALFASNEASHRPAPGGPARWTRIIPSRIALGAILIGTLVAALYFRILGRLAIDWWQVPEDSHGLLVPLFSSYLLWSRRAAIRNVILAPEWSGAGIVCFGLTVLLLGEFGANVFLARTSFVILLTGLVVVFGGWELFRQLRFPVMVLLLGIPPPALLLNYVTLPLQLLAAQVAAVLLPLCGIPVLREGNVIQLSAITLEVAEACSGIRSLISLVAMAIFYGYFAETSNLRRLLLVLSSVPIAIAANSVRIVVTGLCVQHLGPDRAMGFFHEFSGWLVFLVSLAGLFLVHRFLALVWRRGHTS